MPPTDTGLLAIAVIIQTLGSLLLTLGANAGVTRFVAEFVAGGAPKKASRVYFNSLVLTAGSWIAVIVPALGVLYVAPLGGISPNLRWLLTLALIGLLPTVLWSLFDGVLVGLKRFREDSILGTVADSLGRAITILLLFEGTGVSSLLIGPLASTSIVSVLAFSVISSELKLPGEEYSMRNSLSFSVPLVAETSVSFLANYIEQILLAIWLPLKNLGLFYIAFSGITFLSNFFNSIATPLSPHYAGVSGKHGLQAVTDSALVAGRYVSLLFTPLALGSAILFGPFIVLIGGVSYEDSVVLFAIISIMLGIVSLRYASANILIVSGQYWESALTTAIGLGISLLVALVSIPPLGVQGAAFARAAQYPVSFALVLLLARRRLPKFSFDWAVWMKSLVSAAFMTAFLWILLSYLGFGYALIPVYIVCGAGIYVAGLRLTRAVKENDIDLLLGSVGIKQSWVRRAMILIFVTPTIEE